MSQNNTKFKEPLAPTISWQIAIDDNSQGDFTWVQAIYDESVITTPVYACVDGYSNQEGTISPLVFVRSGEWKPLIGKRILSSGTDVGGTAHATTANVTFFAFRGL